MSISKYSSDSDASVVRVEQMCNSIRDRAEKKMSSLKQGTNANWKSNMELVINGKKLRVAYNVDIYHGWGSKGYSGTFQAWYGGDHMSQTFEEVEDIGYAVWNWLKSFF